MRARGDGVGRVEGLPSVSATIHERRAAGTEVGGKGSGKGDRERVG